MNQHLQTILNLIQQAEHLTEEEKTALSKAAKNADKELEITSFKLERTEKVKRTTAILLEETIEELEHKRKAVEAQNRELEIESSLERVRTVAMSMNKPDDMLDVCRTISNQLELLAVKEIRNVQTAIFYKEKGTYMNYEYYAKHNKTFITETTYTNNEVHASFAEKMLKGNGEISISHIKGDEVKDWIKYQKTTNVFIDDYLYTASSLNYYWYSLGPVALGISTYSQLTEEEIDLFKRFLKVFELSYRRYLDIEKAEAQAREAQIEAALERVRSRSLAMHKSEQLADIISTICKEILNLGIQHEQMETCYIATFEGSEPFGEIYLSTSGGDLIPHSFRIAYDEDPLFKQLFAAWQNGDAFFVGTLQGEELKNHLVYLFSHIPGPILEMRSADFSVFPSETFTHALYFSRGYLAIITRKPVPGYHQLFKRFGSALQQSYTRFLDLQKAEAQARESQIQLSLERARTQSMIMQHSNELDDTLRVFHEQVLQLSIPSAFSFLWLPDEEKDRHIFWAAWAEDNATVFKSKAINYPLDRNEPATAQCLIDWKSNEPVVAYHVPPASVNDYFAAWSELIAGVEELKPENFSDGLYYVEAFMKYGCFGVMVKDTLPEDEKKILSRFAVEFERAYTRFLDLQKAEAQARESQIQLALERVRARTMAMQKSDELSEAVYVLFQQFKELGENPDQATIGIVNEDEKVIEYWVTMYGKPINKVFKFSIDEPNVTGKIYKAWKENKKSLMIDLSGDALTEFMTYRAGKGGAAINPDEKRRIINVAFFSKGLLNVQSNEERSEESIKLLERFASVFDQTYTRFLDLQKAEAQARESQIQLALERVRARTMAMQHSDELKDAAALLFQQVKSLGAPAYSCGYNIWEKDEKEFTSWMSAQDGSIINGVPNIPLTEDANFIRYVESKQKGEEFFVLELRGERMQEHYEYLKTIPSFRASFDYAISVGFDLPETQIHHLANFSQGNLLFITLEPCPEFHDVFKRFAAVFEQTYTRFLDLQKAEAQAREATIEAALEKVRGRSLAMHKSEEMNDVVMVLFEKLKELKICVTAVGITIYIEGSKDMNMYVCGDIGNGLAINNYLLPYFNHPITNDFHDVREKGLDFFVGNYSKEEKNSFYEYVFEHSALKYLSDDIKSMILQSQSYSIAMAPVKHSMINVNDFEGKPLSANEEDVLKRFAKVFEQAYTRFLDLQKAEAQAREAQIEAALERVRSRTIAMQRSEDLFEVIREVNAQLQLLNFRFDSADFLTDYSDKGYKLWVASVQESFTKPFYITAGNTKISRLLKEAMERGDDFFTFTLNREEKNKHFEHVFRALVAKDASDKSKQFIYDAEGMAVSCFVVKNIILSIANFASIPYTDAENDIIRRFAFVFDQTYTRFLDLKKAEAQARESQIQLALERVRARTMAMQHSEELAEASFLLDSQIRALGIKTRGCAFNIYGNNDSTEWFSSEMGTMPTYKTPRENLFLHYYEEGQKGKSMYINSFSGEACAAHYEYLCTLPVMGESLKKLKESGGSFPTQQIDHVTYFKYGYLLFITLESVPESHDIFKRFAKVFEQTYTRFLDLQKVEAQAREAQIETALEKVRSRSLAMHKSDELQEVVHTVFEKLKELNVDLYTAIIFIFTEGSKDVVWWLANKANQQYARILVPYGGNPYLKDIFDAKESGKDFFSATYSFEEKNELFHHLFEHTDFKYVAEEQKKFLLESELATMSVALAKNIGINITSYSRKSFSESDNEILKRFAKVFDQAYTRFLDLQKAEAQAREAQIEAALEKVRSRTIAMHKSEELIEVIASVFQQLEHLSFRIDSANLFLNYKENPFKFWMAVPGYLYPSEIDVPYGDFALMNRFIREIKSNATLVTAKFSQEEKNEWVRHLIQHSVVGNAPDEKKKQMFEAPGLAMSVAGVKNIALAITNYSVQSYSDEENEILRRFVIVFDQTYTRFLDLQKAEAQAREAQVEAALERVRSRTTGMQKSEELREVIQMVFEQLQHLGFNIDSAHFNLNYKESDDYNLWSAAPGQPYPVKTYIPYFDHPVFITAKQAKEKGLDFFTESYTQDEKNKFFEHLFKHAPVIPEERRKYILSAPGVAASTVLMNTISLWILNYAGIPYSEAENAILKRFGKVFEQTYTRFLDLEKAEAQALEAIKRASVDRVRAEIASMRTTSDLERITPLIWNELTTLGVPFIRCGVFIMDDEQQQVNTLLSTPDGKAIAAFHLSYNTPGEIAQIIASWRKKEMHKQHWNEAQFIEFTQNLLHQGAVTTGEKYLTENRPTDLYLHFLPFLQGMLYAGNTAPLNDDELQLMQNLADAFSTAYARYEDFNKLEEAKGRIETTLSELKATQHQLVQSEKMASLGELTAGIAHEIQNPLNFVNNFSEVNSELISELVDEIDKGNIDEVKAIAKDIKDNEEKITHHGKRADSIVKGMLLHSRVSTGQKEPTDINALCDEYLRLSYHGLRAKDKSFNADFKTDFDESLGKINIVPQDIGRVLLNLYNNAFYAVKEKSQQSMVNSPQPLSYEYKPLVTVQTKSVTPLQGMGAKVEIKVTDNGSGIPQNIVDKIFQPFFTTKPTGQGTGLGLSLSYDIIKAHGGELIVDTKEGEYAKFIIHLPINNA